MAGGSSAETAPTRGSVCVECGRPVDLLFREYNKGNIRLGRCSYCRSVADKYIEWEFVLIAIDLVLHRVQAYRHLLFNMKPFSTHSFQGRLWQLGVAMAALDAHLRHTALSSEASSAPPPPPADAANGAGAGDPFLEAGGLLLAAVIEHACFAAGVVVFAAGRIRAATTAAAAAQARRSRGSRQKGYDRRRNRNGNVDEDGRREEADADGRGGGGGRGVGGGGDAGEGRGRLDGRQPGGDYYSYADGEHEHDDDGYESSSYSLPPPARSDSSAATVASGASAATAATAAAVSPDSGGAGDAVQHATKMYMAVVYPLFFRLLAAFVMIWDRQVEILNTIELLVATMQFVALSAVVGGPAEVIGMGDGGVAAMAILAGLAFKMGARAVLCFWFGSDPRSLRML